MAKSKTSGPLGTWYWVTRAALTPIAWALGLPGDTLWSAGALATAEATGAAPTRANVAPRRRPRAMTVPARALG